uniref:Uncharacterized protein n=1 Tax=Lotus japonicus TaxID=34305 RepID=I3T986_LOTJA|nr:unknown [Lotus japonicus]
MVAVVVVWWPVVTACGCLVAVVVVWWPDFVNGEGRVLGFHGEGRGKGFRISLKRGREGKWLFGGGVRERDRRRS